MLKCAKGYFWEYILGIFALCSYAERERERDRERESAEESAPLIECRGRAVSALV